jgi:hypothetical protein
MLLSKGFKSMFCKIIGVFLHSDTTTNQLHTSVNLVHNAPVE